MPKSINSKLAWSVTGVIRRWIFGAFLRCLVLPSFRGRGRFTTYCLTSSSFPKLNNFLIFDARFGPRRRGTVLSVKPGISYKQMFQKWNLTRLYRKNLTTLTTSFGLFSMHHTFIIKFLSKYLLCVLLNLRQTANKTNYQT
jgi:hypothetical protein